MNLQLSIVIFIKDFKSYQDTILLIDKGTKKVSSTAGHDLMNNHPFSKQRFFQAYENLESMIEILKNGDLEKFISLSESEALTLHAMMMTSKPYFLLMKQGTLSAIEQSMVFQKGIRYTIELYSGCWSKRTLALSKGL